MVPRPDLVEMHDVAASDPLLLIHLKVCISYFTVLAVDVYGYVSQLTYVTGSAKSTI